jgi:hypothetical protein
MYVGADGRDLNIRIFFLHVLPLYPALYGQSGTEDIHALGPKHRLRQDAPTESSL